MQSFRLPPLRRHDETCIAHPTSISRFAERHLPCAGCDNLGPEMSSLNGRRQLAIHTQIIFGHMPELRH